MGWFDFDFKDDIDFMGYRRWFIGLSGLLAIASIIAFIKPGPRFGTDFVGGTEVEVAFNTPVDAGDVRKAVAAAGFASPDVVASDTENHPNQFMIRVREVASISPEQEAAIQKKLCLVPEEGSEGPPLDEAACPEELRTTEVKISPGGDKVAARYVMDVCGEATPEAACPPRPDIATQLGSGIAGIELRDGENNPVVQNPRDNRVEFYFKSKGAQIMDGLRKGLGAEAVPATPLRIEWIGAKAGSQLRDAAIKSITIAVIVIMLYIAFRFDMRFAPGAIAALVHDVFLAMGAMVLARREVTLSTVAALLTIVGYSINDTVVVYDRIRENLGRYRKMSFPKVINRSVTEMLGRTIKTSMSTALALLPFLFFGSGVIRDFAFTLLVGVAVGTYSSIYVAAPLTELIDRRVFGTSIKRKKRRVRRKKKDASPSSEVPAV
ncbi:MAG: protein translocase subunit SecF [Polyangiaceae bacterium]